MGNYYLVARDKKSNDFKIIGLKSKWYYKNGNDSLTRSNKLEAIDLVTTRFRDSQEMAKRLENSGIIPHTEYDFFIVKEKSNCKSNNIKIHEVLYNYKPSRTEFFRSIAYDSLNNNLNMSRNNIRLFDKLITKIYYVAEYRKILREGLTALPKKLVELEKDINGPTVPYSLKYKNRWMMENYQISRSIIDSFNRSDELNADFNSHVEYFKNSYKERIKLKDKLLEVCSKDYNPGQISIFDMTSQESKEASKSEKYNYVIRNITNFDITNLNNEENKISIVNPDFSDINTDDKKVLKKSLPISLLRNIYLYCLHKSKLDVCKDSFGDTSVLYEDMNQDLKDIEKQLKKDDLLNRSYNYFLVYNRVNKQSNEGDHYQKVRDKK